MKIYNKPLACLGFIILVGFTTFGVLIAKGIIKNGGDYDEGDKGFAIGLSAFLALCAIGCIASSFSSPNPTQKNSLRL